VCRSIRLVAIALLAVCSFSIAIDSSFARQNEPDEEASIQAGETLPGMEGVQNTADPVDEVLPFKPQRGLSFLELLARGGWFMIPLGLLSIAVVAIGVERFLSLRRDKLFPQDLVHNLAVLSQSPGGLDPRQAYQICQRHPSSASYVIRSMLTRVGRPQLEIENAVHEASQREAARLSHLGSWLTLAAAIAPLIGLLGTVWGITQAFYDTTQLVAGQNRAEALAQGIYTALVTTMCGLLIAIPAAIMAHHFENRIIALLNEIEEMIYSLMPQFERYEGQLRFTTGNVDSSLPEDLDVEFAGVGNPTSSTTDGADRRLPVNEPRRKRKPPH